MKTTPPPVNTFKINATLLLLKTQKPNVLPFPFLAARLTTHALVDMFIEESDKDKAEVLL